MLCHNRPCRPFKAFSLSPWGVGGCSGQRVELGVIKTETELRFDD